MQFARDNPQITVVGIGAGSAVNGDSLEGAIEFNNAFGASGAGITMIYDVSFRTWRNFSVRSQPWSIGFDADGMMVFSNSGRVDFGSVEAALTPA